MRKLTFFLTCLLMIGVGLVNAQSRSISGKVISADDEQPVIGASVIVKGTTIGTVTNVNGNFSISMPNANSKLIVSYVGMKTLEIESAPNMIIRMLSDN